MIGQLLTMVRMRLVGHPSVASFVGANVFPSRRPQTPGVVDNAICYRLAGGESVTTFDVVDPGFARLELELTAWSGSYRVAVQISDAVEAALAGWEEVDLDLGARVLGCFRNSIVDVIDEQPETDEVTQWSVAVNYTLHGRTADQLEAGQLPAH